MPMRHKRQNQFAVFLRPECSALWSEYFIRRLLISSKLQSCCVKSDKQKKKEEHRERDDKLHDALEDSFPASDPPPMRQPRHKSGPPKDKKSPQIQK